MAKTAAFAGVLTIPNGQQESNILNIPQGRLVIGLVLAAPAALTGTVAIEGSMEDGGTPMPISVDGNAMDLTAGTLQQINVSGIKRLQLDSDSSEGAERVCRVYVLFDAKGIC